MYRSNKFRNYYYENNNYKNGNQRNLKKNSINSINDDPDENIDWDFEEKNENKKNDDNNGYSDEDSDK